MPHVSTASDSWHRESERHGQLNDQLEAIRAHQPAYTEAEPEPLPVFYQPSQEEQARMDKEQRDHMYAMLRAPMTDEQLVAFLAKSPHYAAYRQSLGL